MEPVVAPPDPAPPPPTFVDEPLLVGEEAVDWVVPAALVSSSLHPTESTIPVTGAATVK
jgi:hypothetical protein